MRICALAFATLAATCLSVGMGPQRAEAAKVSVEPKGDNAVVTVDGKPFTEYIAQSGPKPILWPIIGPTGQPMTRQYPIKLDAIETEKQDHIHHRSLWFTHGNVNGVNFWAETPGHGQIVQTSIRTKNVGDTAVIVTENDWLSPEGKKVCADERTLTFGADDTKRWIDFDVTVKASEGDVVFGDDKEGSFGVRVAGTMDVNAKRGGEIVNSAGQKNADAWGKPAAWVDYHGPVAGKTVGIAILNHPSSFRFPTTWHVRTYGLFCANPFGYSFFKSTKETDGTYTIPKGGTLTLRYRVLLHEGDEKEGKIADAFEAYSKIPKGEK
jgi:hypothetical protein